MRRFTQILADRISIGRIVIMSIAMCSAGQMEIIGQIASDSLVVVGNPDNNSEETFILTARVEDRSDNVPIPNAIISINGAVSDSTSNSNGLFSVEVFRGRSRIDVSFLDYNTNSFYIDIYEDAFLVLYMDPITVDLTEVVIQEQSARENIESTIEGVERMDVRALSQRTQLMGEIDVLRSIQTLSGVTSVGDGASGFNVRGGNADENLILQDDGLIINPTHTLGFFSLFHPDLINSVELYKGNQPAYYGGRLSSVLKVDLREGNRENYEFNGGIGMAASRLTFEGPIQKGKSSFIVGGRISYMNYLLNLVQNINVKQSETLFYDLTVKADARISNKTKIGFTSFLSGDDFQFAEEVNFDYQTQTVSAYVNHLISDAWNLRISGNIGEYESSLFDIQGNDLSRFTNKVRYTRASFRNFFDLGEGFNVVAGAGMNRYTVSPGSLFPEGEDSAIVPETLPDEQAVAYTPFIQMEWDLTAGIKLFGGLRYTHYSKLGPGQEALYQDGVERSESSLISLNEFQSGSTIISYTGWEPRLALNFIISEQTSLKLGYNRGFQYLNQLSNTASATPVDVWKLSDRYIPTQVSDNYNFGISRNFDENTIESSLGIFYKDQKSIVEYRDFPDLLLNEFIEREIVPGIGRSYGIEFNMTKSTGRTRFDINYTYSRSERQVVGGPTFPNVNNGEWYPNNYDKPHSLNLNFSKKMGRMNELAVNFTYSTGRPITAPISNFAVENVLNIPIFSERNKFRIPDYHRLDLSYTIGPFGGKNGRAENRITLSVYNVYSRRNAYSVFFRQRPFQRLNVIRVATLGSIFPAITYNFKFK